MTVYLKMNTQHTDYNTIKAACETKHKTNWPVANLGENIKKDGLQSIIKIGDVDLNWLNACPWQASQAILNKYDDSDLDTIKSLVNDDINWREPMVDI